MFESGQWFLRQIVTCGVAAVLLLFSSQGWSQDDRTWLLAPQTAAQAELFKRGSACNTDNFTLVTASYDFNGVLAENFVGNDRWLSDEAVLSQIDGNKAELIATGTHISEAWLTWRDALPFDDSWLISSHIKVPRVWDTEDSDGTQVGIGMFVGTSTAAFPDSADSYERQSPTVYEVNLASIAREVRFVQAQMIENRLGEDPDQTAAAEVAQEELELSILYCAEDRTLSVFVDAVRLDTQAIDANGAVDWGLQNGAILDVGIMGFAENSDLTHNSPTVSDFRIKSENRTATLWDGRTIPEQPTLLSLRDQHELRVSWLRSKHEQLLPMMRKHGIEMWIIPEGTFDRDPLTRYVAPARSFSHGVTHMFIDAGDDGLKAYSNYRYPNETYVGFFDIIPEDYDEWLLEAYDAYQPKSIGLAYDGGRGHNSSLTYDAYQRISRVLGSAATNRFVSARDLIEDYVDTRLADEWSYYKDMVIATDRLAQRALSNEVIDPGTTTTADLKWWFEQEMASWGVSAEPWFTTNTNIQRFNPESGEIVRVPGANGFDSPDSRPYQRGDLITIDCGIAYLGFKTDIQRVAYILREGESDLPDGLKKALANRNTVVMAYQSARPGQVGRAAAAVIEETLADVDFRYSIGSHSIGYHGHALGPGIRSTHSDYNKQRENRSTLRRGSYMSIEGETMTKIAAWNNQEVTVSYEEQGYLTEDGYKFFVPLQDRWFLIQ